MDLKSEIKNVMLSSLKNPSDIKIGIEIENIIYNDKNERIMVNPGNDFSATELLQLLNNKKNIFNLTPEAKLIATNFRANKGRLPWPLEKGVVIQGFGRQRHPVVKTATIQSNGVIIATEPSAQVRSVFEGEVMSVIIIKGTNPSVLIRHGNFITLYTNLSKLYVRKGEKVGAKQIIGEVFTNKQTGETQLQFGIFNNINALNPKDWVYQM